MGEISITGRAVRKDDGTWDATAIVSMNVDERRELLFAIPGIFDREGAAISASLHYGMYWVDQQLRP